MTTDAQKAKAPGRLFLVLWLFTLIIELISLQGRLAIFGGTGWLTDTKYTTFSEALGFVLILATMIAAVTGLWTLLFGLIQKIFSRHQNLIYQICTTLWIIILAVDLVFRHKITQMLGSAFNFFEFATGVGGVWRMIVQAFQWYGDIIALCVGIILTIAVATWFFFRWFLKKRDKVSRLDRLPWPALISFVFVTCLISTLFMSFWASDFPKTQQFLRKETMFGSMFNAMVNTSTDFDNDGYGKFDLPPDTAPFDGSIHPHALDIPEDGIDQDLILGDLKISQVPPKHKEAIEQQGLPNTSFFRDRRHVFIILMESVRYDMLDAKVDNQPVMPQLKKFISEGALRINNMFATRGFTQNSVTQTFWGSYFDPGHSMVDDFKALGYHTAAFSGEDLLDEKFDESLGWNRAGDTVVDPRSIEANIYHHRSVPANVLMDEVEKFIQNYDTTQPLFMYLFYQDPHFPYQQDNPNVLNDRPIKRSEITVETRPRLYRTYANQVYHLDMAAGRLIQALKDKQILDNSLVIFVSDHGESLFDDGYLLGHGIAIQDLMTHGVMVVWGSHHDIPDIISHPDIRSWIYKDFNSPLDGKGKVIHSGLPVTQFIGATTVPSAISWRYEDGSRITYEFDSKTAWRESRTAHSPKSVEKYTIPPHETESVDTVIDPSKSLKPSGIYRVPIDHPFEDKNIQNLIHTWEYLQWYHQKQ